MGRWQALMVTGVLLATGQVCAKDTAILLGLSCDPNDSAFGMNFYNWRVGLKNLGWNSEVFCGPPNDGKYSNYRALQEGSILDLLEAREKTARPGDNFLVFINDHGHEKPGAKGQTLTGYDDQGEACPLMPMGAMVDALEGIDRNNAHGMVWVLNSSCHSGAFVDDLSPNSGLCVATNAGTWSQSFQEDFIEIIGWNLAQAGGEAKNFDYLKEEQDRLRQKYASYAMGSLLPTALEKDQTTIAVFTRGLGLDHLNVDAYEAFRAAYGAEGDEAAALDAQRTKDEVYQERRARGEAANYFAKFPAREARRRMTARAITSARTPCARFDLDRRNSVQ